MAAKKKVGGFPTVFDTVLVTTTANITLSSMTSALSDFWISTNFELATMIPETVPLLLARLENKTSVRQNLLPC